MRNDHAGAHVCVSNLYYHRRVVGNGSGFEFSRKRNEPKRSLCWSKEKLIELDREIRISTPPSKDTNGCHYVEYVPIKYLSILATVEYNWRNIFYDHSRS